VARSSHRLTLEIDPGGDPITGRVADDRDTWPFSGWLAFAAALEQALDAAHAGRGEGTEDPAVEA
jgi:hypothetical protein